MKLKKHQLEAVEFLKTKEKALLADDTGLGKTFTIISTLNELKVNSILIVCPMSIKYQWLANLDILFHKKKFSSQIINTAKDKLKNNVDICIINYELIIKSEIYNQIFNKKYFDACILDEAHKLKSLESKRTKILLTYYGIARQAKYVYGVTGTPLTDHIIDFFPILYSLARSFIKPYDNYYAFGERFCGGRKQRCFFGGKEKYIWNMKGSTNIEELQERLKNFMLRRTFSEIEKECITWKEKEADIKLFNSNKKIDLIYEEEIEAIEKKLENTNAEISLETLLGLKEYSTIRNKIAQEKIYICFFELLKEIMKYKQVIIFTYHTTVAMKLKELLFAFNPIIINGKDNAEKKYKKIKQFKEVKDNKNKHSVLIGQIKAMGEGIDGLQYICNHGIFFELSLTPADIHQAKARLLRMGQKSKEVSFSYYLIKNTIEEKVFNLCKHKWDKIINVLNKTKKQKGE